jgi:hypothetical protein
MTLVTWALLALFVPLGVAAFIGLIVPLRRTGRPAALISVAGALVSLASAGMVLAGGSPRSNRAYTPPSAGSPPARRRPSACTSTAPRPGCWSS